jgi:hypothetical protein
VVTSRVEGIHSLLKSYLNHSVCDLFTAWKAISNAVTNQIRSLRMGSAQQGMKTPLDITNAIYEQVRSWVSFHALRQVQAHRNSLGILERRCTGLFTSSLGLPCAHRIRELQTAGQRLSLDDFDPHWHLNRGITPRRPLLEPRRVERVQNTTVRQRRAPSAFEVVEEQLAASAPARAASKCTSCGATGHTRVSRACPDRYDDVLGR